VFAPNNSAKGATIGARGGRPQRKKKAGLKIGQRMAVRKRNDEGQKEDYCPRVSVGVGPGAGGRRDLE